MTNKYYGFCTLLCCAVAFFFSQSSSEVFRPLITTPRLLALSGGGAASWSGVGELPNQPSNIQISSGHQIHLGFANMTNGLNPSFFYGRKASKSASFGFGGLRIKQEDHRQSFTSIVGGFSLFLGSFFSAGASLSSMMLEVNSEQAFGVDMNIGIHYKLSPWLWLGGNIENLNESDLGHEDNIWQTRRLFNVGAQIKPVEFIKTYYDVNMYGFQEEISHVIGTSFVHGKTEDLAVLASIRADGSFENFSAGIGVVFKTLLNKSLYGFRYSMGEIPISGTKGNIRHAFAVQVEFNLLTDYEPPVIAVKDEIGAIAPSVAPDSEFVYFKILAEDKQSAIDYWILSICSMNESGKALEVIKSFTGRGIPPKVIRWSGRDSRGMLLKPGFFTYRLIVEDASGNRAQTNWQMIEIRE